MERKTPTVWRKKSSAGETNGNEKKKKKKHKRTKLIKPSVVAGIRRRPSHRDHVKLQPNVAIGRSLNYSYLILSVSSLVYMGDNNDGPKPKRVVFVTVGTTCFDALVKAVDTQEMKDELQKRGYTHLVIQMGRGTYTPMKSDGSLIVDYFTFSPSIQDYLRSASLVISHAGSGSIFETLKLGKPLIVVVNEDLMDNHQCELAEELAERKHLYYARPQTLHQTVAKMDLDSLVPYTPGDGTPVARIIYRFLGFPDD